MKYHKTFDFYRRQLKSGKSVYYVRFYDQDGNRTPGKSTGQTSKAAATTVATNMLSQGNTHAGQEQTFAKFAENWWDWEKCAYIKRQKARGKRLSKQYAQISRGYLKKHILPFFKNKKLHSITPQDVEDWLIKLKEDKERNLKPATINHCLKTLRTMLREASRLEIINKDPTQSVDRFSAEPEERGVLQQEEIRALFDDSKRDTVWDGDHTHFALNLLAAYTGMRLGEIQGLQVRHVHKDYVVVEQSWARTHGLTEPKWGAIREIPIPPYVYNELASVISKKPNPSPESFLFSMPHQDDRPLYHKKILLQFYNALKKAGISEVERKRRNIVFHSWRHTFNSSLRSRVPDYKLRLLTGHKTAAMTEHYTTISDEDLDDVRRAQESMFTERAQMGA